jgi:predicted anti-sigma-YlaC factor YlaD
MDIEPESLTDCALVQDLLPLYLDNEVSPESHARIAQHIAQCERCAAYLAGARSMRAQLLRDQQAVQSTVNAGPTVAQTRQPVVNSLAPKLGRALLMAAGVIGALILAPVIVPIAIIAAIPVGLVVLIKSLGSRVRGQPMGVPRPSRGAIRVVVLAVLSVLAALVSLGMAIAGFVIVLDSWSTEEQLMGVLLSMIGVSGLILINQRRGWLPQYASPVVVQQLFRVMFVVGAIFAGVLFVQGAIASISPVLIVALIVLGAVWWLKK